MEATGKDAETMRAGGKLCRLCFSTSKPDAENAQSSPPSARSTEYIPSSMNSNDATRVPTPELDGELSPLRPTSDKAQGDGPGLEREASEEQGQELGKERLGDAKHVGETAKTDLDVSTEAAL